MRDNLKNHLSVFLGLLLFFWFFSFGRIGEARDPKTEEMDTIQEIAGYLNGDAYQVYNDLKVFAGAHPQIDWALPRLEKLNQKALEFHERLRWNKKSPWRTTHAYEDLVKAFGEARDAFIQRSTYSVNPAAFEEIAYLMDILLTYYLYPADEGPIYSTVIAPQVVYTWIPTFYTYSSSRRFP